jgi:hypothetical protein
MPSVRARPPLQASIFLGRAAEKRHDGFALRRVRPRDWVRSAPGPAAGLGSLCAGSGRGIGFARERGPAPDRDPGPPYNRDDPHAPLCSEAGPGPDEAPGRPAIATTRMPRFVRKPARTWDSTRLPGNELDEFTGIAFFHDCRVPSK